ncbi:MAG: hypothetical protein DRQ40_05055 [Gammaproteobacteria bacterium]|nr:MAG: hypothetical protein DRQ40_05055 [Gammaproteobacteria bacterium]
MGMNHNISYFIGNQMNAAHGDLFSFDSFKELADEFQKCSRGVKQSAYFVRGKLEPMHRKDVNLSNSNLLVIDGDEGLRGKNAPNPEKVHKALIELNLNHFIYTTHSHTKDKNKFRCIVECTSYKKKDLRLNNRMLLNKLKEHDVGIKFVKEMNTWSQPWFVPTRDNPKDGMFEAYSYTDGEQWRIEEASEEDGTIIRDEDASVETLEEMYENIRTGKEFHTSLRTISYQLIKDGMSTAHVIALLQSILNGSKEVGSERWTKRFSDVERIVTGAVEKNIDPFEICDIGTSNEQGAELVKNLPRPPGLLGQLCDEAFKCSRYPDRQIALVASLGVIAGICGRKFNVDFADKNGESDPTALNLYMTLVGGTGSGKDGIKAFIEKILFNSAGITPAASFIGSGEFTSVRALDQQMVDARSQVVIDGEAGISMKNRTGDKAGVQKAILSLYGRGHHTGWSDPKTYSNADETVPARRALALTKISESTEIELFSAYRDTHAFENGLIPRNSIFRIVTPNTVYNRDILKTLSPNIIKKFNSLIRVCSAVQAAENPKAHFIYCDDVDLVEELYKYADELKRDSVNNEVTRIKQIMSTRMFVKALRYAGIAVVFNKEKATGDCLVISWEEWEWARKMVEYELSTVENCFAGYEDNADGAVIKVASCLSMLIKNTHPSKEAQRLTEAHRKSNTVPLSVVQRLLRRDSEIKALAADPTRTSQIQDGVLKCLEYMQKIGTVSLFEKGGVKMVKVQPVFNDLYDKEGKV